MKLRKSIRLIDYDYSKPGWYFITICSNNKDSIFGKIQNGGMILNKFGNIVKECIIEIPNHFENVRIDEYYVIMPNHIHFIVINEDNINHNNTIITNVLEKVKPRNLQKIPSIIGSFKSAVTKKINELHENKLTIWQRSYYDRIIRNEKELYEIRNYIKNNPLQWELDEYRK